MTDEEKLATVERALSQVTDDGLLNKWLTVREVVTEDGHRWVRFLYSDEVTVWDAMGMLDVALEQCRIDLAEERHA